MSSVFNIIVIATAKTAEIPVPLHKEASPAKTEAKIHHLLHPEVEYIVKAYTASKEKKATPWSRNTIFC